MIDLSTSTDTGTSVCVSGPVQGASAASAATPAVPADTNENPPSLASFSSADTNGGASAPGVCVSKHEPTVRELQHRIGTWSTATFGPQTLLQRVALLAEETGEVARAVGKQSQGIRPSDRGNLPDELADLMIALLGTAHMADVDLWSHALRRLDQIQARVVEREQSGGETR